MLSSLLICKLKGSLKAKRNNKHPGTHILYPIRNLCTAFTSNSPTIRIVYCLIKFLTGHKKCQYSQRLQDLVLSVIEFHGIAKGLVAGDINGEQGFKLPLLHLLPYFSNCNLTLHIIFSIYNCTHHLTNK